MAKVWIDGTTQVEMADYPGMQAVHLSIDGKAIRALPSQTILEAVRSHPGIGNVPALCHHPAVKPYGACRLCTVEAEEGGKTKFVAACIYQVGEGLTVRTNTENVRKLRKGILELLLARCPNVPKIQELAKEYGVEKPRFAVGDHDCILCGLCVRACKEIIGRSAIGLANRGIYREVAVPFYAYELGGDCVGCGDCAYVCPTGAISLGPDGKPVLPKVKIAYPEVEALLREAELAAVRR